MVNFPSSVVGGQANIANDPFSVIVGGCFDSTGTGAVQALLCNGVGNETALGGIANVARGWSSSVVNGYENVAADPISAIVGGCQNLTGSAPVATDACSSPPGSEAITGGDNNVATGYLSVVSGGWDNIASTSKSAILGGKSQTVSSFCQSIPATNTC